MSSPPSTEDHRDDSSKNIEVASTAPVVEPPATQNTATEANEKDDEPAVPSRPSTAKLTSDDTSFAPQPLTEGTATTEEDHHDDEIPYPDVEEAEGSLLPPPDFRPFFTLIEDTTTGEHHHPTVHYLFDDDDPEILTAAALETVADEHQQQGPEDERFVIVDMNADGREVVGVSSLSPDWQALNTKVMQAPSWGDESKAGERGLMLRISGQEAEDGNDKRRKGDTDRLLKAFDDLAGTLDEVLGSTIMDADTQIAQSATRSQHDANEI